MYVYYNNSLLFKLNMKIQVIYIYFPTKRSMPLALKALKTLATRL